VVAHRNKEPDMRLCLAALGALLLTSAFSDDVLANGPGYRGAIAIRTVDAVPQRSIDRRKARNVSRSERFRRHAKTSDSSAAPVVAFARPWIAEPWYAFPNHISVRYPSYGFAYGPCGWREPVPCSDD
jgi:hypothetical protein